MALIIDKCFVEFRQMTSLYSSALAYADVEMEYTYATLHRQFFNFYQLFKPYIKEALASSREDERFHFCNIIVFIEAPRHVLAWVAYYLNYHYSINQDERYIRVS